MLNARKSLKTRMTEIKLLSWGSWLELCIGAIQLKVFYCCSYCLEIRILIESPFMNGQLVCHPLLLQICFPTYIQTVAIQPIEYSKAASVAFNDCNDKLLETEVSQQFPEFLHIRILSQVFLHLIRITNRIKGSVG